MASLRSKVVASAVAVALGVVASYEGLRTKAYVDPVGIVTICYGHTATAKLGQEKTPEQCWTMLEEEVAEYASAVVQLTPVELTQNQLAALTSFTYNVGPVQYKNSTLRKKLLAGDYCGAGAEFKRWNRAGGKVLKGLTRRRAAEQRLFMEGTECWGG